MRFFAQARWFKARYLIFLGAAGIAGCSSFDHLTRLPAVGEPGPKASECGACHVEQYQEWQLTAHAAASTNAAFQADAGNPPEEECLQCHGPLSSQGKVLQARSFAREEGVSCVSCHLVDGKMLGPHPSTALVSPHPIGGDRAAYGESSFCTPCHVETHEQWQKATVDPTKPTCQQCHLAKVSRTASQGTNFFSDFLVSFEKKLPSRSHDIRLEKMVISKEMFAVTMALKSSDPVHPLLEITLHNNLPHDLPTGTYGTKEIRLQLVAEKGDAPLIGLGMVLGTASQALASGQRKTIELAIPSAYRATPLHLQLIRTSPNDPGRQPIILASFPLPSAQEVRP